jgi:hypothetical protein
MRRAGIFAVATDLEKPAPVLQVCGHHAAAEKNDAMLVEFVVRARRTESLEVIGRRIGVEMHREELALDQVGLRRLAEADGYIGLAHRQIELLIGGNQRDVDVRIEIEKLSEPRRQPMHADARGGLHLEFTVRPLAAVGQLRARRLELHEDFMRGAIQQFALLGEDQAARMAVEE